MLIYDVLKAFNVIFGILFLLCYAYQFFYIALGTFVKPIKYSRAKRQRAFAFIIPARNEENVIPQLCDSIRGQNYPSELIDVFVVADNCTDNTASVAREQGAFVFERRDTARVGKGYALGFVLDAIEKSIGLDSYDGFFVVDADNILDKDYVRRMNDCIDAGNGVVMCYRNSKNYADNHISAGYSRWFLRASRHLNLPRQYLGLSAEITGTGFFVSSDLLRRFGGWRWHCLVEDIEFTVNCLLCGEHIAFCYDAIVYDEQPTSLSQSVRQRIRWCRGYFQVARKYGVRLLRGLFRGGGFSFFDMTMSLLPAFLIGTIGVSVNFVLSVVILIFYSKLWRSLLMLLFTCAVAVYVLLLTVGILSGICEWGRIKAQRGRVILYFLTFPFFVLAFIPISLVSLFGKADWKPISHHAVDVSTLEPPTKQ